MSVHNLNMDDIKENIDANCILNLPGGFEYTSFKQFGSDRLQFHCNNLKTKVEAEEWVKRFGEHEYIEWRIARTYPHLKAVKCHYRVDYRCQHSSTWYESKPSSSRKSKNIQCPAQLIIKIVTQSKYDAGPITIICLQNKHNHSTEATPGSLKYRSVSTEAQECLRGLFATGHSPLSAYHTLQSDAFIDFPNEYLKITEDRSKIPDIRFCYNMFYKEFKKDNGSLRGDVPTDCKLLKCKLDLWCEESKGSASIHVIDDEIVISIMTPLMKRVHSKLVQSGDLMFVDTSSHCDRNKRKIYLLYTHCVAGGLPLAYIITAPIKQDLFEKALLQYCNLDENRISFYGKGNFIGPQNIITDNDLSEKTALRTVWSYSNIYLSSTHVLRTIWQSILDPQYNIYPGNRNSIFLGFKKILTAECPEKATNFYSELMDSELKKQCPKFFTYIESIWWPTKDSWCLYSRQKLQKDIHKNYVACAMRAVKDIFLKRTKPYNTHQLVDLILTRFDKYYSQRIIDFINSTFSLPQLKNFLPDCEDVSLDRIVSKGNETYLIRNMDEEDYVVDIAVGFCTCFVGISGALCKHQCAIILHIETTNVFESPNMYSQTMRQLLFAVANGEELPDDAFDSNEEVPPDGEIVCKEENMIDEINEPVELEYVYVQECIYNTTEKEIEPTLDTQNLGNVFSDILERIKNSNSPEMIDAANKFCNNYEVLCKTDQSLKSALSRFGKYDDLKRFSSSRKVQSTSISKRKGRLRAKRRC